MSSPTTQHHYIYCTYFILLLAFYPKNYEALSISTMLLEFDVYICFYYSIILCCSFTYKLQMVCLLLKLYSIYSILLLLRQKSYACETCLQVSNLTLNSFLDFQLGLYHQQEVYICVGALECIL